jgi:SEC-C motif-containing protein
MIAGMEQMVTPETEFRSTADALKAGLCPCGNEAKFASCCQPLIQGKKKAETAEQLMRARYTAFSTGAIDFIIDSHHSKTRDQVKREEVEEWSKKSDWLGLKVLETAQGGPKDNEGVVVFHAKYRAEGKEHDHLEHSQFERENGEWKFLDAQGIQQGPLRREGPKVGRNDPCPCGSGKKFKKCHG